MSVVFKFNPAVANKELTHSFNHQVYELKGDGEFTCTDGDWLSLSKVKVEQYEGEGEARKLVELDAFELVRQGEGEPVSEPASEPASEPTGEARARRTVRQA